MNFIARQPTSKKTSQAGQKKIGATADQNLTRRQHIANFYKDEPQASPKGKKSTKDRKKGKGLRIALWAAMILLIIMPIALIGGSMIGEWLRTKNLADFNTAAGSLTKTILPLQPYIVPVNRQSSLRFEPYLELASAEDLKTVCHYRPRFKAAILGVLNKHFAQQPATPGNTNAIVADLQNDIRRSATLKEIQAVYVKARTITKKNKNKIALPSFPQSQMVTCP